MRTIQRVMVRVLATNIRFSLLRTAALSFVILPWASPSLAGGFSSAGSPLDARLGHSATLLPWGKVLVTGGQGPSDVLASAELYDPISNTWSMARSMSVPRVGHTATLLLSGRVLVAAGSDNSSVSAELYDPASDTWSATGPMTDFSSRINIQCAFSARNRRIGTN